MQLCLRSKLGGPMHNFKNYSAFAAAAIRTEDDFTSYSMEQ